MPRTVSAAAMRAMFAQETAEVFLMCITIYQPAVPAFTPLRFVYNNQPITRSAGTFQPALFTLTLPPDEQDKLPSIQLSIDNVDRSITDAVRTVDTRLGRVSLILEVVLASSPNTVEAGPFTFQLLSINYDTDTVTGTLGLEEDVLNTAFPSLIYTPNNSPGLFK